MKSARPKKALAIILACCTVGSAILVCPQAGLAGGTSNTQVTPGGSSSSGSGAAGSGAAGTGGGSSAPGNGSGTGSGGGGGAGSGPIGSGSGVGGAGGGGGGVPGTSLPNGAVSNSQLGGQVGGQTAVQSGGQNDGNLDNGNQPGATPEPTRSPQEIYAEYVAVTGQIRAMLPPAVMSDASARSNIAAKAIPVVYHHVHLIDELSEVPRTSTAALSGLKQNDQSMLYTLNDAPTVEKVKSMLASTDPTRKMNGQMIELGARWMTSGSDKVEATKVVDELEALDRANSASVRLGILTATLAQSARTQEANTRLQGLITDVMTDPYSKRLKAQIQAQKKQQSDDAALQAAMLNRPIEIAGKTADGKGFTTADLKGKVVLVDFWATWCPPCRAALPHVVETYNLFHNRGLEIVGVSNDYSAKALTDFTANNNMPWPQIFDADAAANHQWNPLTLNNGIHGIPVMFLIDRKGILRSVTAREDMDSLIPKLLAENN